MKTDSIFWIASQSKPITATALMILVDEGKVKLDDPVEKYLPEFKDIKLANRPAKPKTTITVRHILSHTSGMRFSSGKESPTLDGLTLADCVEELRRDAPDVRSREPNMRIPTPASIPQAESSRSSAACLTRISSTSDCLARWE